MDLRKIKKLIELVEASGITELEVRAGDESVRIARPAAGAVAALPEGSVAAVSAAADSGAGSAVAGRPSVPRQRQPTAAGIEVRAPMAGTFYVAPEPGAEPFVVPGQSLQTDAVVCIIESMKMMNEIRLTTAGECVEVLVSDAEPVSTGQLLLRFR